MVGRAGVPELRLLAERKVRALLPQDDLGRAEASGVLASGGRLLVIFDNTTVIGMLDADLSRVESNRTIDPDPSRDPGDRADGGYEDIARDPGTGRLYLLVEAAPYQNRRLAKVDVLSADFQRESSAFLDFEIEENNKGMEGLSCVSRDGEPVLVALCEGNRCRGGREGKRPGGGRLQLFRPGAEMCDRIGTVHLPAYLPFEDYSSVAVRGDRLAVLSQRSSALWVGILDARSWAIADDGKVYDLPRDDEGHKQYGTAEGVSWLDDDHLVVVSDRATERRFRGKHRSVHIFALP